MSEQGKNLDFESLLDQRNEDMWRPQPLPGGHYLLVVKGWTKGESSKKKTPLIQVKFGIIQPHEDVDQSEIERRGIDLAKYEPTDDFYITEKALARIMDFGAALGLQVEGRTPRDVISEMTGCQVLAFFAEEAGDNGKVYSRIQKYVGQNDQTASGSEGVTV